MPLIPGFSTLTDLITISKYRADMVHSNFVTNDEWTSYINLAFTNMYDLLVEKYGEMYFATVGLITADGINTQFALPQDCYKKIGIDMQYAGGPQGWVTVH